VESTVDNKASLTQCQPKPIALLDPPMADNSQVADHAEARNTINQQWSAHWPR
jgi:hypothetical protein